MDTFTHRGQPRFYIVGVSYHYVCPRRVPNLKDNRTV